METVSWAAVLAAAAAGLTVGSPSAGAGLVQSLETVVTAGLVALVV